MTLRQDIAKLFKLGPKPEETRSCVDCKWYDSGCKYRWILIARDEINSRREREWFMRPKREVLGGENRPFCGRKPNG